MGDIRNAKVTSTMLGTEDHGILTAYIFLDFGGSSQGFGGYGFDRPVRDARGDFLRREGHAYGMEFIRRVLETLKVESWEKLPGTPCRVRGGGWGCAKIEAIGHYLEDRWFDPEQLSREMHTEATHD